MNNLKKYINFKKKICFTYMKHMIMCIIGVSLCEHKGAIKCFTKNGLFGWKKNPRQRK